MMDSVFIFGYGGFGFHLRLWWIRFSSSVMVDSVSIFGYGGFGFHLRLWWIRFPSSVMVEARDAPSEDHRRRVVRALRCKRIMAKAILFLNSNSGAKAALKRLTFSEEAAIEDDSSTFGTISLAEDLCLSNVKASKTIIYG
ncbi:unnamed protein product [Lupinus luteus]|uniref:Uncharacterized protein n=1 Tax=Lupinus luteus TaxID=3873 RepID=A0AAV1WAE9_LUPLU